MYFFAMICFIAPNPDKEPQKDGYLQRVSAIDRIFSDKDRRYLCDAATPQEKAEWLSSSSMIYVQSIYRSKEILPLYPVYKDKIITDLHGVVPEELDYLGNKNAAEEMQRVESEVFKYGKYFVAVTETMVEHYRAKYHLDDSVKWIVLPIFDSVEVAPRTEKTGGRPEVIYAGGLQRWQCPELMIQAVEKAKNYDYVFYTHQPRELSDKLAEIDGATASVRSGSKEEVFEAYKCADLGLLLREDHVLNRVSCPTKLIEYLTFGIVPVILSSKIGDFEKLGYSYVQYDRFLSNDLSSAEIETCRQNNYEVARKLHKVTENGILVLRQYFDALENRHRCSDALTESLTAQIIINSELKDTQARLTRQIDDMDAQIADLRRALNEQNDVIVSQQEKLSEQRRSIDNMINSKRWQLGELLHNPTNIKRFFSKPHVGE
jgi:hypothetical protein